MERSSTVRYTYQDYLAIPEDTSRRHEIVDGPPDLVVEVLSPSNAEYDRGPKRKQYMAHGVPELWLVDIEGREVAVWRPGADEPEIVRDALVWRVGEKSFEIPLEEVFRG